MELPGVHDPYAETAPTTGDDGQDEGDGRGAVLEGSEREERAGCYVQFDVEE